MRLLILTGLVTCLILPTYIHATDSSIYWGHWTSKDKSRQISIFIEEQKVTVKVNNKTLSNITKSFVYGKGAVIPFLYLYSEEESIEHSFYLTLGFNGKIGDKDYNLLRGFYVKSIAHDKEPQEVEDIISPLQLFLVENESE